MSVPGATIGSMTHCAVQRCPNVATTDHTFRERTAWVNVCEAHAVELANPDTEWILDSDQDPVTRNSQTALLVGESLRGLNEYVVKEIAEVRGGDRDFSRTYSHKACVMAAHPRDQVSVGHQHGTARGGPVDSGGIAGSGQVDRT